MPSGLLSILWGALEVIVLGVPYASDAAKSKQRLEAHAQFKAQRVSDQSATVVFDGEQAQVLQTEETYRTNSGRVLDYVLTVFAVTPANRYFLFKSNPSGRPYLNELTSERAQLVLKGKFRSYAKGDA